MRRIAILLLFAALVVNASEKWSDSYHRGVKAVQAKDYSTAVDQLQRSIAEMPNEAASAHAREQAFVYVPHFWLGIAKFETHDYDGALREWKTSEDQGVVQGTDYYSRMREFVAQAQRSKSEMAHNAVAEPRKNADVAMNRAMSAQMEAVGAGGDRVDSYRSGKRKMEQALADFNRAGNDAQAYQRAADGANQARELFVAAADEAKRIKAARPPSIAETKPVVPAPQPQPVVQQPQPQPVVPLKTTPAPVPQPAPVQVATQTPPKPAPQPEVESEASVAARVAAQQQHAKEVLKSAAPPSSSPAKATVVAEAPQPNAIEPAYRAFARGELTRSEELLTSLLSQKPSAEAFLLRGCTRYTRAMLSRTPAPLLADASHDFREAVRLNRSVRLDRAAFSPKLVSFFEQEKGAR
jgi:tetratricopeptide (TPR) repeat protein